MSAASNEAPVWSILIQQIRNGDQCAEAVFVARYGPLLHELVPIHGVNRELQRHIESGDLVQSALWNAIQAIRAGTAEFASEAELEGYLRTLGLNERNQEARRLHRKKRDARRTVAGEEAGLDALADRGQTPSKIVSQQEQLARVAAETSPDELALLQQKYAEEAGWQELAAPRQTTPEALRKRIDRVRKTLRKTLGEPEDL